MNKEKYTCDYCEEQFIPKRKGVQRFCNSKCRKKFSYHKNKVLNKEIPKVNLSQQVEELRNKKFKIEKVSAAGAGNAALGVLAVNAITAIVKEMFITENKKTATKGDIQELKDLINTRYFEVHNITPDPSGRIAYFDMSTNKIVYFNEYQNKFEVPLFDLQ